MSILRFLRYLLALWKCERTRLHARLYFHAIPFIDWSHTCMNPAHTPVALALLATIVVLKTLPDGTTTPVTPASTTFTSSDETVATIDSNGKITPVAPGVTVIRGLSLFPDENNETTECSGTVYVDSNLNATMDFNPVVPAPAPTA